MRPVAALFCRRDSNYKTIPGVDVYDSERDARTYDGPHPVIAHPPCRGWGELRHMAKPRPDERNLARLSVALVREFGGVLEHPAKSDLWRAQKLPRGADVDQYGGRSLVVDQFWWGHKARKRTILYIVGCSPADMPALPMVLGNAEFICCRKSKNKDQKDLPLKLREHTPPDFALWLVELARRCFV